MKKNGHHHDHNLYNKLHSSTIQNPARKDTNLMATNTMLQSLSSFKQSSLTLATATATATTTKSISKTLAATVTTTAAVSNTTIISQIKTMLSALSNASSGMNAFLAFKDVLISTSPVIYFSILILAGLGLPLSEDALCIFVGSILPTVWYDRPIFRMKLILALYFGVVLSDILTFSVGRVMGMGLLEPLSKRLNLRSDRIDFCEDEEDHDEIMMEDLSLEEIEKLQNEAGEEAFCEIPTTELKATDNILAILENVGDYAGFVIRLSIGMRLPMMLATGFSGKVPIGRFIIGTSIGALLSLSIQLTSGWLLSNNPTLILGLIGLISTFPLVIPSLFAFGSWINLMYMRWNLYKKPKRMSS